MNGLVAQATATLQESGGRMTTQRRIILEALEALGAQGEHPNAEQVYEVVRRQNDAIHTSTVYRTLGWLAEAGLVNAQYLDPGVATAVSTSSPPCPPHTTTSFV